MKLFGIFFLLLCIFLGCIVDLGDFVGVYLEIFFGESLVFIILDEVFLVYFGSIGVGYLFDVFLLLIVFMVFLLGLVGKVFCDIDDDNELEKDDCVIVVLGVVLINKFVEMKVSSLCERVFIGGF